MVSTLKHAAAGGGVSFCEAGRTAKEGKQHLITTPEDCYLGWQSLQLRWHHSKEDSSGYEREREKEREGREERRREQFNCTRMSQVSALYHDYLWQYFAQCSSHISVPTAEYLLPRSGSFVSWTVVVLIMFGLTQPRCCSDVFLKHCLPYAL